MIDRTTISAIAAELGVSWHTVSTIAMRTTADLVAAAGPDRLAGVRVIGVDEHRWAPRRVGPGRVRHAHHRSHPDPRSDRSGAAARPGSRSFSGRIGDWLAAQPADFAAGLQVVAMDGFAGYKTAASRSRPGCGHGDGPVPRRRARRGQARPDPPTHPTADPRTARAHRRPALRHPTHRPHPHASCSQPANTPG